MNPSLIMILLSALPLVALAGTVHVWRSHQARERHSATTNRSLRTPGDSLRRRLEGLDGEFMSLMVWVVGLPPLLATGYLTSTPQPRNGLWLAGVVIITAAFGALVGRFIHLMRERADCRVGLSAEEAVAEELNQLLAEGCQVFH